MRCQLAKVIRPSESPGAKRHIPTTLARYLPIAWLVCLLLGIVLALAGAFIPLGDDVIRLGIGCMVLWVMSGGVIAIIWCLWRVWGVCKGWTDSLDD